MPRLYSPSPALSRKAGPIQADGDSLEPRGESLGAHRLPPKQKLEMPSGAEVAQQLEVIGYLHLCIP